MTGGRRTVGLRTGWEGRTAEGYRTVSGGTERFYVFTGVTVITWKYTAVNSSNYTLEVGIILSNLHLHRGDIYTSLERKKKKGRERERRRRWEDGNQDGNRALPHTRQISRLGLAGYLLGKDAELYTSPVTQT